MILQLNVDDTFATRNLTAFDCSWTSRYKEEDERFVIFTIISLYVTFIRGITSSLSS